MKPRTLALLVLVLAILAGLALLNARKKTGRSSVQEGVQAGDRVLGPLDINQVAHIEVQAPSAHSRVEHKEGSWLVSSLYYYPADFGVLSENLRLLDDLTVGQVMHGGRDQLEAFGLQDDTNLTSRPVRVTLSNDSGQDLATLYLGAPRQASRDEPMRALAGGQYVRVNDGPVILVETSLDRFPRDSGSWIDRKLLDVNPSEVTEVHVTRDGSTYSMSAMAGSQYSIKDLASDEHVESAAAARLVGALQSLNCINVADPALTDKDLGLEQPSRFIARTRDGRVYTAWLGGSTNDPNNRYARFQAEYDPPPAPTREEVAETVKQREDSSTNTAAAVDQQIDEEYAKRLQEFQTQSAETESRTEAEHARLRPWTYLISNYSAQSLTLGRDEVVRKTAPKSEPLEAAEGVPPKDPP